MKKLLTSLVLQFSLFVFSQEYTFDYKLTYKNIGKERNNEYTSLVNSNNKNIFCFFFSSENKLYARILDYNRMVGHTFKIEKGNKEIGNFDYFESNKLLENRDKVKDINVEKINENEILLSYKFKYDFDGWKKIKMKVFISNYGVNLLEFYGLDLSRKNLKLIFDEVKKVTNGNLINKVEKYNCVTELEEVEKIDMKIALPKTLNFIN